MLAINVTGFSVNSQQTTRLKIVAKSNRSILPENLLLKRHVVGELHLLLDSRGLHADHDASVVPAELAVNSLVSRHIALTSSSANQSCNIPINDTTTEKTLNN